ncbi:MAG TPA: GAF domain-containing protein [Desulfuromonadales bacterium]|nr:GAF domain-containing protein [Desulfuromonadales bacterium]
MVFNSLKVKLVGLVALIVIAVISLASWRHYHEQKAIIELITEKSSVLLIDSVVANIQSAMKSGHTTAIDAILHDVRKHDTVSTLRIVDDAGIILHSADKRDIGRQLPDDVRGRLLGNQKDHFYFSNHKNEFSSITRIANTPDCHGCHDARKLFIANIETEIALNDLTHYIDLEKKNAIISSSVMIALIIGALFMFLVLYVDRPVRTLIASMQRVKEGEFVTVACVESSFEMNTLSHNFNDMTTRLQELMETTVTNERELARAEEALKHHQDTHLMNLKLAEQLIEIENLNISLEERIEEVEQASLTIANLATELKQKNANLENAIERLSTIYTIGLAINSTMDIDRLFNLIVRSTISTLNAQIGYIILYDKERQTLNVTNLIGGGKLISPRTSLPMKETSVSAWVINNGKPLLIEDIDQTPQFDRFSDLGYERKTLICTPLIIKDEIIGTISVVNKGDDSRFSSEELEMLTTIAAQAAIAIKNATMYEEQQQTYLNTIQALVSAIEASDSYTRGHSERVTRYSVEVGHRLQLPSDRLQILERAAILHDIGKIGIDLSLLHKAGKLSAQDIHDLQQHPKIGMKILEPIAFLKDVRTCIGQHHERYDGLGYPQRIKYSDQLFEARIISVADAFDAMTSDRPYRKALAVDAAIAELIENSGTQFDPAIIEIFTAIFEEESIFSARFTDFSLPYQRVTRS